MRPAADDDARARITAAIIELVGTEGYAETTVEGIVLRSEVSRGRFDALFSDKRDCYLAVYEDLRADFMRLVAEAVLGSETWRDGLRRGGYRAHDYFSVDMVRARYLAVEVLEAGDRAAALLDSSLEGLIELVHAGRYELEDPDSVDRSVAEHIVGSFWTMLAGQIRSGELEPAGVVVPQLMFFAVTPYLGEEAARQELAIKRQEED